MPKMVPRDFAYGLAHASTALFWMDLRRDDIHWTLTDTGWAKAAWGMLFPQFLMGVSVVLYDGSGFDADLHLNLIKKLGVSTFCAPPTIYRLFAQMDLGGYDLSSIRRSLGAGEPLNPEVMKQWEDGTGHVIYDGYGQTETVILVANFRCNEVRPGSMGLPAPGFTIGVVDEEGNEVPTGEEGQIAVKIKPERPVGLFKEYWRDQEAMDRSFLGDWYLTGDKAYKDEDGYYWFVGRADDVIISAGYRIGPFEVESALIEHPSVVEAAAVAAPDPDRGSIVKAYVVLREGTVGDDSLARALQEHVKAITAPYKYPRAIEFVTSLPKTVSGKIRRVELRQRSENPTDA